MTRLTASLAVLWLCACGPTPGDDSGGGGAAGDVDAGGGGGGGGGGGSGMEPDAGNCGAQQEDIELIDLGDPPDLLIVLDRSGSMASFDFDTLPQTRWQVMKSALQSVTQGYDDKIRFGLAVYPTDNSCGVSAGAEVDIAISNSAAIASYLNATSPDGWTPSPQALQNAAAIYAGLPVNPDGRFVLFATDGAPNCGGGVEDQDSGPETVQAVEALAAQGIQTFVLGFGSVFGLDVQNLNECALAGQVPRPGGPPHYYHASSQQQLEQALEQITGDIIVPSCEYQLASLPPDPDLVTVTVDGQPVPRDPNRQNGWDYYPDMETITFFGSYCDLLQSGSAGEVRFVFGCPGPVID